MKRLAAITGAALLLVAFAGVRPAGAHYVQPPGELEAAAAVVLVEVTFNYAIVLPRADGEQALFAAKVPGPRGTGAVVNSGGTVLTGQQTAFLEPGEQEALIAINQAFRSVHSLSWTTGQLAQRMRVADAGLNGALQKCYQKPRACATFNGRTRTVVFNTSPARRLAGRYAPINDGFGVLSTRFDRERTPTVGFAAIPPQDDGAYRALGWGNNGALLPALPVAFENGALTTADLTKVQSRFGNGGDGTVIVDSRTKGNVVAVVRRGTDGKLAAISPLTPLQFAGVGTDRGPLHPSIDQALGYFQGEHYTHAVPLLQSVTQLIPDRGLLEKLKVAKAKRGTFEDKSFDESGSMERAGTGGFSWLVIVGILAAVAVASVFGLVWSRRRRQRRHAEEVESPPSETPYPDDDLSEFDDLMEDQSVSVGSEPDGRGPDESDGANRPARVEPSRPVAVTTVKAGARSPSGSFCSQCGVGLTPGDRFCYHCGHPAR